MSKCASLIHTVWWQWSPRRQCDGNDLYAHLFYFRPAQPVTLNGGMSMPSWYVCRIPSSPGPSGTHSLSDHLLARQALTRSLIISWPVRRSLALLNLFVSCDWHSAITCVMSQRCLCHRVDCQTCSGTGGMMETVPSHWCASCHSTVVGDVL